MSNGKFNLIESLLNFSRDITKIKNNPIDRLICVLVGFVIPWAAYYIMAFAGGMIKSGDTAQIFGGLLVGLFGLAFFIGTFKIFIMNFFIFGSSIKGIKSGQRKALNIITLILSIILFFYTIFVILFCLSLLK